MTPGSVLFWKNFSFTDGGKSDKLLIVLNHQRDGQHMLVPTTSMYRKWRPRENGCQASQGYFFVPEENKDFDTETWILLDDPQVKEISELEEREDDRTMRLLFQLDLSFVKAIVNCFKKTEDCSPYYEYLLEDP